MLTDILPRLRKIPIPAGPRSRVALPPHANR